MLTEEMYQEVILDHYRSPQNSGRLENPTVEHRELNPLCGDDITVQAIINEHDILTEIKFTGQGCAISQASMSLLTEHIKEKSIDEIKEVTRDQVIDMLGIPISPVRLKCALLGLKAISKALEGHHVTN